MWFRKSKKIDQEQNERIVRSQKLLLDAAVSTADMAQFVTTKLKQCLEDAIRQFEIATAIMSDALLVCDIEGYVRACNPAAQRIFGEDGPIKGLVLNLLRRHGSIMTSPEELWSLLRPGTIQETVGLTGLRKTGESFPIEVTMTRLDRSDGSVAMLMLIRDISDIVALKREAEINARHYRSLFDLCFDGILVVQEDKIVAANHQAGRLFGCRPESLLRVEFARLVSREHRDRLERLDDIHDEPIEAEAVRGDGTPMSLLFSGVDIVWNDHKACLITVRDLSTLKQLEKRYDNGLDMLCCFDGDFLITFANETFCAYHKVSRAAIVGLDVRSLMTDSERDAFILHLAAITQDRPTRRMQVHVGSSPMRFQDWIDHVTFDEQGQIVEVQRSGRDITDLVISEISQ